MSSFNCPYCGKPLLDTPTGYIPGCSHCPHYTPPRRGTTAEQPPKTKEEEARERGFWG